MSLFSNSEILFGGGGGELFRSTKCWLKLQKISRIFLSSTENVENSQPLNISTLYYRKFWKCQTQNLLNLAYFLQNGVAAVISFFTISECKNTNAHNPLCGSTGCFTINTIKTLKIYYLKKKFSFPHLATLNVLPDIDLIVLLRKRLCFGCRNHRSYQWFQHLAFEVQAITHSRKNMKIPWVVLYKSGNLHSL